mmetsp:Transcript_35911/g.86673  ORF Transcript_35911/g.86673 Transcript_35911/m.86673 type:complete len:1040 (+) Transcript_35911:123-3242(+)
MNEERSRQGQVRGCGSPRPPAVNESFDDNDDDDGRCCVMTITGSASLPHSRHNAHRRRRPSSDDGIKKRSSGSGASANFKKRRRNNCNCPAAVSSILRIAFAISVILIGRRSEEEALLVSPMVIRPSTTPHARILPRARRSASSSSDPSATRRYHCCNEHHDHRRKESFALFMIDPAGKYLNQLRAGNITLYGDDDDDDDDNSDEGNEVQEEYDDDDYAMSIPMPVRVPDPAVELEIPSDNNSEEGSSDAAKDGNIAKELLAIEGPFSDAVANKKMSQFSTLFPPNEEAPIICEEDEPSTIYEGTGAIKSSKFDDDSYAIAAKAQSPQASSSATKASENVDGGGATEKATKGNAKPRPDATGEKNAEKNEKDNGNVRNKDFNFSRLGGDDDAATNKPPGIKAMFQNLLGGNDDAKVREETERARKWREWMTSGRKVRDNDETDGDGGGSMAASEDEVSLDESLLSLDKGADYVVVAVPAEAADGVGPILSSFPGGKLFQKTIGKTFQDAVVNGDSGGGSGKNNTSAASATISLIDGTIKKVKTKKKPDAKKKPDTKKKPDARKKKPDTRKKKQPKGQRSEENTEQKQRQRQRRHDRLNSTRDPGRISANDYSHNIRNILSSTILRDVRNPVAWVFAWATLWSVMHRCLTTIAASADGACVLMGGRSFVVSARMVGAAALLAKHMCLPTVQHTMMVSAMSLLLVFRTNSAYQRFAEGRKIWNDIVDTARDFSRMIKLYEFALGASKCRRINGLLASFPYLLRHRIRPSLMTFYRVNDMNVERDRENSLLLYPDESRRDTDPDAAALAYDEEETGSSRRKPRELCWVDRRTLPWKLIPGSALGQLSRAQNRPLWACDRMAKELAVVEDITPKFTNRERLALIGYVDKLSRSIGACERIHQTVVPLNYARHALRSLTVWLWTLPFVLVKDLGLLTGPAVAIIAWTLFGVYEIGSRIEDPFQGTLRLSIYCDAIRRDVLADAIARDTAFDLDDEEGKSSRDDDDEYDAIFELESDRDDNDISGKKNSRYKKRDFLWGLSGSYK